MAITNFRAGGVATDTPANLVCLCAATTNSARFMTFESPVGTDYVVPAGKTLIITKVIFKASTNNVSLSLGYGDDGVAEGAAAPTTPVVVNNELWTITGHVLLSIEGMLGKIPTGKYPYMTCLGDAVTCMLMGYLS